MKHYFLHINEEGNFYFATFTSGQLDSFEWSDWSHQKFSFKLQNDSKDNKFLKTLQDYIDHFTDCDMLVVELPSFHEFENLSVPKIRKLLINRYPEYFL